MDQNQINFESVYILYQIIYRIAFRFTFVYTLKE